MADDIRELAATLTVDGQTYNINAEQANQVKCPLKIEVADADGAADPDNSIEYKGNFTETVRIVSANYGGKFNQPIKAKSPTEAQDYDGYKSDDILNYSDIYDILLKDIRTNSVLYIWDNNKLYISGSSEEESWSTPSTGDSPNTLKSICIVTGANDDVDDFTSKNFECKKFAAFIYVANNGNNAGFIYFGTVKSKIPVAVQVSASRALKAEQLVNPRTLTVNLGSSTSQSFNGSDDVDLGVKGILDEKNGGTGAASLSDVTVGKASKADSADKAASASKLEWEPTIKVDLATTNNIGTTFVGNWPITLGVSNTLPTLHGGTGQRVSSKADIQVGKADTFKINIAGDTNPYYSTVTVSTEGPKSSNGNIGDIWIKYSAT